jgi:hypothetical protein
MNNNDIKRLRELATRIKEVSESDENQAKIARWYAMDEGSADRPNILIEIGGIRGITDDFITLQCEDDMARGQEHSMLTTLFIHDYVKDDSTVLPYINMGWNVSSTGYGIESQIERSDNDGKMGAYHISSALTDLTREVPQLKKRQFTVDRDKTMETKAQLEEIYDGILKVRLRGNPWWTMGLTQAAVYLIGVEGLMMQMYDDPEGLHMLMSFLRDDYMGMLDFYQNEGLLNLNNEDDYIGSGSRGYTRRLPVNTDGKITTSDLWCLIESQETVSVSPDMYEEFVFQYEKPFAERFGSVYYGCCEPVHNRWHLVKKLPNLKRVSVSPWCDQEALAADMQGIVFSRKPNPSLISTDKFDETAIREDLRKTLQITKKYNVATEIAMKDVHTIANDPSRLPRWVEIAREEVAKIYG